MKKNNQENPKENKHNYPQSKRKGRNPRFEMRDFGIMRELYRQGYIQSQIAQRFRCSQYYISKVVRNIAGNYGHREQTEVEK